jgi:acyl carrier protein
MNASIATYEADIRRLVADQLGVGVDDIGPDVSLPDDLAADSLDLVELALALEARWGVTIPDRRLESVRTYRELLDVMTGALEERSGAAGARPTFARFRIVDRTGARADHVGPLDPYTVDILLEEARRAGPGGHVEVEGDDGIVASARRRLAARGVAVSVRRPGSSPRSTTSPPSRPARETPH